MILNDLTSKAAIGRTVPRVGVALALAASLLGSGQLVHADSPAPVASIITVDGAHLPFIVCGVDTHVQSGGTQSILLVTAGVPVAPAQLDPAAIGQTFTLHGRNVADCGAGNSFKGLADQAANSGAVSMPAPLEWLAGTRAGTTSTEMGALSCAFSATQGCTMLVPVATGSDGAQLQSVIYASMEVTVTGANSHSGKLLGDAAAIVQ